MFSLPLHTAWIAPVCASALSSHATSSKQTSLILSRGMTLSLWLLQPLGLPAVMALVSFYSNSLYKPGRLPSLTMSSLRATTTSGVTFDSLVLSTEPSLF